MHKTWMYKVRVIIIKYHSICMIHMHVTAEIVMYVIQMVYKYINKTNNFDLKVR